MTRFDLPNADCEECGLPIQEEGQMGCVDCGSDWTEEEGRNCPECGHFGHRCVPEKEAESEAKP